MPTLQWLPPYSVAVYLGLLAGCLLVLWLARRWATSPLARSPVLLVLRAIVLSLLILMLLNPVHRSEIRSPPRPGEIVFLVDCSKSMGLNRPGNRLGAGEGGAAAVQRRRGSSVRPSVFRFGRQLSAARKRRGTPRRRRRHAAAGCLAAAAGAVRRRSAGGRGDLLRRAHDGNLRLSGGGRKLSQERDALARLSGERPGHDGRRGDSGTGGSAVRPGRQPRARPRADRRLRVSRAAGGNPHPRGGQSLGQAARRDSR